MLFYHKIKNVIVNANMWAGIGFETFLEKPCDDSYHDIIFWYLNIGINRPTTFSVLLIVFLKVFMSI